MACRQVVPGPSEQRKSHSVLLGGLQLPHEAHEGGKLVSEREAKKAIHGEQHYAKPTRNLRRSSFSIIVLLTFPSS